MVVKAVNASWRIPSFRASCRSTGHEGNNARLDTRLRVGVYVGGGQLIYPH
ncbi:MAG: hypothetical protein N2689_07910 [Verrucomicrobiae bacterium]|nr:hypothetical protein [Verrucomicrobiae bacterium]